MRRSATRGWTGTLCHSVYAALCPLLQLQGMGGGVADIKAWCRLSVAAGRWTVGTGQRSSPVFSDSQRLLRVHSRASSLHHHDTSTALQTTTETGVDNARHTAFTQTNHSNKR